MYKEVILAVVQALTEFLPISSSGHLALFGNYFGDVNLFYVTLLHCASVLAIIVYTRREIRDMVTLANDAARSMWLYVAIGIIPAGIIGLFFRAAIENAFSSPLIIGVGFIFTGNILILCYSFQKSDQELTKKRALLVGLAQILALFALLANP